MRAVISAASVSLAERAGCGVLAMPHDKAKPDALDNRREREQIGYTNKQETLTKASFVVSHVRRIRFCSIRGGVRPGGCRARRTARDGVANRAANGSAARHLAVRRRRDRPRLAGRWPGARRGTRDPRRRWR